MMISKLFQKSPTTRPKRHQPKSLPLLFLRPKARLSRASLWKRRSVRRSKSLFLNIIMKKMIQKRVRVVHLSNQTITMSLVNLLNIKAPITMLLTTSVMGSPPNLQRVTTMRMMKMRMDLTQGPHFTLRSLTWRPIWKRGIERSVKDTRKCKDTHNLAFLLIKSCFIGLSTQHDLGAVYS